ncbi:hypothetical protein ABPG72_020365, partial [Tetrahymena utriculariae]
NCTLDDKQLAQINNSLKKCSQLESLTINLHNDQIYSHLKFLLDAFEWINDQISINNQQNEIVVYENILEEDTICNLINLKKLELNL